MKRTLGNLERLLFAYTQLRSLTTLRTGDLVKALAISSTQESKLFTRLSKARLIAQVQRGMYLVPKRLPLGSVWSPDEFLALNTLFANRGGKYQICGPNAFNRYGYEDQIPNRVYVYNNRFSGERSIGGIHLVLIKVSEERLGAVELSGSKDGEKGIYSSRARTLLDAVYDWSRFQSLPRAYEWIRRDVKRKLVIAKELVTITRTYGDTGTIRRMGYVLERASIHPTLLRTLERRLKRSTSYIPLDPMKSKRGRIDKRWGIVDNE